METKNEEIIMQMLGGLDEFLDTACKDGNKVEYYNYEMIKHLQDNINYKLNNLVQCEEEEEEE